MLGAKHLHCYSFWAAGAEAKEPTCGVLPQSAHNIYNGEVSSGLPCTMLK